METRHTVFTERLKMVPFATDHLDDLFRLNSDPEVMRFLGPPQSIDETAASVERQKQKWAQFGFGWWAVFVRETGSFVGSACLQHLGHVETNPLEIGWRLLPDAQGKGYATEAGRGALNFGFEVVGETYLTAVADPENIASENVMRRLGMTYVGIQTHYDVPCLTYEINKP